MNLDNSIKKQSGGHVHENKTINLCDCMLACSIITFSLNLNNELRKVSRT